MLFVSQFMFRIRKCLEPAWLIHTRPSANVCVNLSKGKEIRGGWGEGTSPQTFILSLQHKFEVKEVNDLKFKLEYKLYLRSILTS